MASISQVQALRALAAVSVMLVHYNQLFMMLTAGDKSRPMLFPLSAGVDVFFVISGFIMVYSSSAMNARTFLVHRLTRIAPIYWVTSAIAYFIYNQPASFADIVRTLLFIPYRNASGEIAPINGVGWTLNYEMFFYVLFAGALATKHRLALPALAVLLVSLAVYGFRPHANALWLFWTDPIIVEFVFGMMIAWLYLKGFTLPDPVRVYLLFTALIAFWFFYYGGSRPSGFRFLLWGGPAALMLIAAVSGRRDQSGQNDVSRFTALLGDASYALYLIHPLVTAAILLNWQKGLNTTPIASVLATGIVVTIMLSIIVHVYFEKPVMQWLRKRLEPDTRTDRVKNAVHLR